MHALPLHVRRFFDWNKTHPSIGRRVEFVRRSLAGDPSVLRYGRPLWVSWALVAAVPVLSVGLIVHRAGLFGSEVEILQRRATLLLEDVEGQLADAPSGGAARLPRAIRLRVGDLNVRAREDIERALALAPGDVHTRYLRAWTDVFAERWLAAEQAFGEVLDASPDHAGALYGAALVQAEQGRWQEARQLIARASAAEPNDPQIARLRRRIAAHAGTNADGNGGAREE
jgi:tetratricopeptide (TPR) repeat protein